MRTTFEITAQGLGSQNAVCGGGRYDVLGLGGPPTKGIGFAIGEDRLILSLEEAGKGGAVQRRRVHRLARREGAGYGDCGGVELRDHGSRAELPAVEAKIRESARASGSIRLAVRVDFRAKMKS